MDQVLESSYNFYSMLSKYNLTAEKKDKITKLRNEMNARSGLSVDTLPQNYTILQTPENTTPGNMLTENVADVLDISYINDYIVGDCWAITIMKEDSTEIVLYNTYVEKNHEFLDYNIFRNVILKDINILLNEITVNDSIVVYMYGQNGFKIVAKKLDVNSNYSTPDLWNVKVYMSQKYASYK